MFELRVYTTDDGKIPFTKWLGSIDNQAQKRVRIALRRLEDGNTGNLKSIGDGVHEIRLPFGAGFRIYLGMDGQELVILLHGGTKQRQSADIAKAKSLWTEYQSKKKH